MSEDVSKWLEELGLGKYAATFAENDIDFRSLPILNEEDFKNLGVSLGHRRVLQDALSMLDERSSATTPPSKSPDSSVPGPQPGEAERRQLTVMFCDLVGSTELSQKLDPEDLRELNRAYQDACKVAIERYEGYIARYMGDGVLAYFGYPQAHEDDAERAVHAGLGLLEAIVQLNANIGEKHGVELSTRVGIATGPVIVGDLIGEGASQESAVVGDTANLAARLQAFASPNAVFVGPTTHDLAAGRFTYSDLGLHELKGFAAPVQVWHVLGESQPKSRFEARHVGSLTAFIGRDREVEFLLDRWNRVKRGEGQAVLLSGEAGIGKSRIVQVLGEQLAGQTQMHCQCSPYHANSILYPIIRHLEQAAHFMPGDRPEQKLEKLEALLANSIQNLTLVMPLLATLLSIPVGARYSGVDLSPQQQKDKTLEAIADHITGIAQQQSVLFVLEDAHWADPTTQELIELLINPIQVIRLLVVVSFRPEFAPSWEDSAHVASLALDRLDPSECVAIVNHVVGGSTLPGEAVDQIIAKTDGIPLFVEELTKTVLEASRLRGEVEEPGGTGQVTGLTIPATLHDSLTARLDRLGWIKEVAQVAATIGREFSYDLLVAVSPLGEDELRSAVNRLADAEFVFPQGVPPQASYTFKHALVRDAAYESQLLSKRAHLHTRIANVLEETFAEEAETQPELLAYHFTEGGHLGKATHYWKRAGERAAEHAAHREAIGHFSSGLDMFQKYTAEAEHSRQEVGLLVGLAGSMRILDRNEEALEVLTRAETLSIDGGYTTDLAEVHYLRGNVYFPMGNIDGCLQEHELSRQYAQQAGSSEGEARALSGLGDAYYMRGQMITAHEYFTRCIELCRKHELRHIEAANLQMLGVTRFYQNELKRALEDTLAAAEIAKELEQHRGEMVARLISSEILANMADLDQAKFQLEEGQVLVRRLGAWRFEALYLCCMAKILRAEGHASEALGLLERATAISRKTGVEFSGPAVLGALALTTDDADIRQSALSEGEELLQAGSVGHNHFRFYRDAIEATLRVGDWDNADRFAAALTDFTRPEPLPWTNFYVSRGHSLAAYGRGQRDQGTLSEIARLAQEARDVDLRLALVALEGAIETT